MFECKIFKKGQRYISLLCKKYPEYFEHINPKDILVVNTYGAGRRGYLGKIYRLSDITRTVMDLSYSHIKFIIEINVDRIHGNIGNSKTPKKTYKIVRNAVLFHELFHVNPKQPWRLRDHNVKDFTEVLKKLGISIWDGNFNIPNVITMKKGST